MLGQVRKVKRCGDRSVVETGWDRLGQVRTGWDRLGQGQVRSCQIRIGKEKSDQLRTVMISLDQSGQVRTGKVRQVMIGLEALP